MSNEKNTFKESKSFKKESLIYNVTEDILCIMEKAGITKSTLAQKLGTKTKSHVSQLLSGSRNMTLGTLSDICHELNASLKITITYTSENSNELSDTSDELNENIEFKKSLKMFSTIKKSDIDHHKQLYKNKNWLPDEKIAA